MDPEQNLAAAVVEHRAVDLFSVEGLDDVDALAHGCNCAGAMGRGIAVEFKRRWPDMFRAYRDACKVGTFAPGDVFPWSAAGGRWIYNLGTQKSWRSPATVPAIQQSVTAMAAHAARNGVRSVAMPRVGAGLGGLGWDTVEPVLRAAAAGSGIRFVVCTRP